MTRERATTGSGSGWDLHALLSEANLDVSAPGVRIQGIADDSREVGPGSLFVAVPGTRVDGRRFIPQAVALGAVAILTEGGIDDPGVPVISVGNARHALARLAQAFQRWPTRAMATVGVTGTNGKTTMTLLIESIMREHGMRPGVMGTIESRFESLTWPAKTTTPGPVALARITAEMRAAGADALALEVSSHAIEQERVEGIAFDAAIFTNLSQDHLDYHHTMEEYAAVKRRLFTELLPSSPKGDRFAVVNIDDPEGDRIVEDCPLDVVTYGHRRDADVSIVWDARAGDGSDIRLRVHGEEREVRTPLLGAANVMNATAAVAWAHRAGICAESIWLGLNACRRIPGRLEPVREAAPLGFQVLVDYSHTPDSLRGALAECRALALSASVGGGAGGVLVVFGCGGDRDTTKRAAMGEIAGTLADEVWLTNDNPRTEDPERIADMAMEGLHRTSLGKQHIHRVLDRATAIQEALAAAQPGDIVLIAGKGHETYQEIGDRRFDFDDAQVVREWCAEQGTP